MKWTNQHKLQDRVIRVLEGKYKGNRQPELNRLSVTDLLDDPLPRLLYITRFDDIVRDYSDLFTMVQGTSLHSRYEENFGDDDDVERKFEDVVQGIILVGKADIYNRTSKKVIEVKQTGCYGPKYRLPKWTKQLNVYAWQRRIRQQEVLGFEIDVWYRDWKENNKTWRDYPQIPYQCLTVPLWTQEKADAWIQSQVAKHLAQPQFDNIEDYKDTPCSDKQRGYRWEAYKGRNKTPTKVGDTYDEVSLWVMKQKEVFTIIKSQPVFCNRYCKARSICPLCKE